MLTNLLSGDFSGFFEQLLDRVIYVLPVLIISLVIHELAHGLVSHWLGDPTAKDEGRLTLNPLKHIDPVGFVLLLLFGFGWAKPVPVRLRWYKHPKRDFALTAAAGPVSNFLLALVGSLLLAVAALILSLTGNGVANYFFRFFYNFVYLNIVLGVFNLIPIPPLDGSRIVMAFLPNKIYYTVLKYENYISIALMVVIITGLLDTPLRAAVELVSWPFFYISDALYALLARAFI